MVGNESTGMQPNNSKSQFLKIVLGSSALFLATAASDYEREMAEFCNSIDELRAEAVSSKSPQRVSTHATNEIAFICGHSEDAKKTANFCAKASSVASFEFPHRFPWLIYDCILPKSNLLRIETVAEYTGHTGRRKINHLWASWADGTNLNIRFVSDGDLGDEPKFKNYLGKYEIAIWKQ